jgi:hypothetical protein
MALESACQPPMAEKFWQAAERKGAINFPFQMSTEVRNKNTPENILNSLLVGAIFYFSFFF